MTKRRLLVPMGFTQPCVCTSHCHNFVNSAYANHCQAFTMYLLYRSRILLLFAILFCNVWFFSGTILRSGRGGKSEMNCPSDDNCFLNAFFTSPLLIFSLLDASGNGNEVFYAKDTSAIKDAVTSTSLRIRIIFFISIILFFSLCGVMAVNKYVPVCCQVWKIMNQVDKEAAILAHTAIVGGTPLHIAALKGHYPVAKALLKHGANIDPVTSRGATPLLLASLHGQTTVVELLLSKGAEVDRQDVEGRTPLQYASWVGHLTIVNILMNNGANVNHLDVNGWSALMFAAHG